jgi:hypothetical protein
MMSVIEKGGYQREQDAEGMGILRRLLAAGRRAYIASSSDREKTVAAAMPCLATPSHGSERMQ